MQYNKGRTYEEIQKDIQSIEENSTKLEDKFANQGDFNYCKEVQKATEKCMKKYADYSEMQ